MRKEQAVVVNQKSKGDAINLLLKIVITVLFISGATVFSYPFMADTINSFRDQLVIDNYKKDLAKGSESEKRKQLQALKDKNKKLVENNRLLNVPGIGLVKNPLDEALKDTAKLEEDYAKIHAIGAIFIPSIQISLPLFDETNVNLLEKGATVLQGTSFPIGGDSTHAVITGHSGLSSKKIFTDLDKLKKGDLFFLEVLGERLAYRVIRFKIVLPTESDSLKIAPGNDLVTLVTCTPYMVNTHRLLVTGVRVPIVDKQTEKQIDNQINDVMTYSFYRLLRYVAITILCFGICFYWVVTKISAYRCSKRYYDLIFYARDGGSVVSGVRFCLIRKRKNVKDIHGEVLVISSNAIGKVVFKDIPGGKYTIRIADDCIFPEFSAYISHLNDALFTLKGKQAIIMFTGRKNKRKYRVSRR